MNPSSKHIRSLVGLLVLLLQMTQASGGSQFSSHISVNTPARSYSHGVGDPLPQNGRRYQRPHRPPYRVGRRPTVQNQGGGGYPRLKPTIPFDSEDRTRSNSYNLSPWQYNNFQETSISVLPPSPYKVDSPDPESLWPEGLFLPPLRPYALATSRRADNTAPTSETSISVLPPSPYKVDSPDPESLWPEGLFLPPLRPYALATSRRADNTAPTSELDPLDPYLLEGSEARLAVKRAKDHGLYYFHDIPHIESLLANQELRLQNDLKPHRLGSIRYTWPYNRP